MSTNPPTKINTYFLTQYFDKLKDPRRTEKGNFRHSLSDILLLTISAVLSGEDEWEGIIYFGKKELDWLKEHGTFEYGIPSQDTLRRFFSALDNKELSLVFTKWASDIKETFENEVIAIDGKTIRGAKLKSNIESIAPHVVSAYAAENKLCLAQEVVEEKSNEINAIPKLLKILNLEGTIVTIDAMGCQKKIAKSIIKAKADYILAVKGNQPELELALKDTILLETPSQTNITEDVGHGRVEKRTCKVFSNMSHFEEKNKWENLNSFVCIESEVYNKSTKRTTKETRYYITSLSADAKLLNKSIRKHWSVENNLHWTLDVLFKEDSSRKRMGNEAENINIINKFVLNMVAPDKSFRKGKQVRSKKMKRKKALYEREYRNYILGFESSYDPNPHAWRTEILAKL